MTRLVDGESILQDYIEGGETFLIGSSGDCDGDHDAEVNDDCADDRDDRCDIPMGAAHLPLLMFSARAMRVVNCS